MIIKQFEMNEKAALFSFLEKVYPTNPRMFDERFWNWHFAENPYSPPGKIPVWVAKEAEEIVGQMSGTPVRLKVGEQEKSAMWIVDLMIRPDFRRRGLMKKLVLDAENSCEIGLGMNTAEQHSTALLESIGWKMFGRIPRYSKLLFPGEALREISKIKILRVAANTIFAPLRPRINPNLIGKNLRVIERFDSSFDDLWRESSAQWQCAVARRADYLNWQFVNQPDKKYEILAYYESEKLLGYAVVYFRKPEANGALSKAAISDLSYHPSNATATIDTLIKGALQLAIERRAGALVTDVLDAKIETRLKSHGFSRVKNPLQLLVKSDENRDILEDTNCWFATRGDADASIFEQPNL